MGQVLGAEVYSSTRGDIGFRSKLCRGCPNILSVLFSSGEV